MLCRHFFVPFTLKFTALTKKRTTSTTSGVDFDLPISSILLMAWDKVFKNSKTDTTKVVWSLRTITSASCLTSSLLIKSSSSSTSSSTSSPSSPSKLSATFSDPLSAVSALLEECSSGRFFPLIRSSSIAGAALSLKISMRSLRATSSSFLFDRKASSLRFPENGLLSRTLVNTDKACLRTLAVLSNRRSTANSTTALMRRTGTALSSRRNTQTFKTAALV